MLTQGRWRYVGMADANSGVTLPGSWNSGLTNIPFDEDILTRTTAHEAWHQEHPWRSLWFAVTGENSEAAPHVLGRQCSLGR